MFRSHLNVTAINAFNDNYIWAISCQDTDKVAIVDPGDADVTIKYLQKNKLVLSSILITHHHHDHVGGITKLLAYANKQAWPVTVYGPTNEKIALLDVELKENDTVKLDALNCEFTVLELPGHTHGHIAYFTGNIAKSNTNNNDLLFCGDTLFSGGCGRVFEGTHEQMHNSLSKLAKLPKSTLIYCAHEYTQANLSFALAVEPNNTDLKDYVERVRIKRKENQATIPSNIGLELKINPFLRCNEASIKHAAQVFTNQEINTEVEAFSAIRTWKNNF